MTQEDLVEVSQDMIAAGLYRLRELAQELLGSDEDRAYVVSAIYRAMYERRAK